MQESTIAPGPLSFGVGDGVGGGGRGVALTPIMLTGELPLLVHGVGVFTIGPPGVGVDGAEPHTPSQALLQHGSGVGEGVPAFTVGGAGQL